MGLRRGGNPHKAAAMILTITRFSKHTKLNEVDLFLRSTSRL